MPTMSPTYWMQSPHVRSLVAAACKRHLYMFANTPEYSLDDLISVAMIHLAKCLPDYSLDKGSLSTYIYRCVRFRMMDLSQVRSNQAQRIELKETHYEPEPDISHDADDIGRLLAAGRTPYQPSRADRRGRPHTYTPGQVAAVGLLVSRWGGSYRAAQMRLEGYKIRLGLTRVPSTPSLWRWSRLFVKRKAGREYKATHAD